MTAIAGATGRAPIEELRELTLALIHEQRRYGSASSYLEQADGAVFAGAPYFPTSASPVLLAQPFQIAADLRIDNRDELCERVGVVASGLSDAALLLKAWQKGGENSLDWLVGDFAFAIFDSRARSLYLARDVTGHRALHYAFTDNGIAFASMPAALGQAVGKLEVERTTLAKFAIHVPNESEQSCFQDINRVRPGEITRIEFDQRVQRRFYWNPDCTPRGPTPRAQVVEEYRDLLDKAVAARIQGCTGPLGAMLSSGFDSSAVTATAARLTDSPGSLIAFTSAPSVQTRVPESLRRFGDESAIAAQTAKMHGIRHVIVRDTPRIVDVIREQAPLLQLPVTSVINMAWWVKIRSEAAAAGATCLLTGESGNHSLNIGGLYYLSEWLRRGQWITWARQAAAAARSGDSRLRGVLFNSFEPWMPTFVWSGLRRLFLNVRRYSEISFLRPEWQQVAESSVSYGDQPSRNFYAERLNILRVFDFGEFRKAALAGHGIVELDPMSDRRLLEFSLRIPPEHLYWDGVHRPMMREALSDRLPKAVFEAKGRGLQSTDWAARFSREEALTLFEEMSASTVAAELFDLDRMRESIERWPTQDWNEPHILQEYWSALTPALATGVFAATYEASAS